jgi:hypothetical protein
MAFAQGAGPYPASHRQGLFVAGDDDDVIWADDRRRRIEDMPQEGPVHLHPLRIWQVQSRFAQVKGFDGNDCPERTDRHVILP